jgi:hypothetical protein
MYSKVTVNRSLFERTQADLIFAVHAGRNPENSRVSSELSKSLSEAGVKIRIRKEATYGISCFIWDITLTTRQETQSLST